MNLLRVEFDCEVLTPMFLSGVDQTTCELRAASLRGALRSWYRALLGGQGVTRIKDLKKAEAAVFGTPDAGSPVAVRLQGPADLRGHLGRATDLPDWNAEDPDHPGMGSPTRYLWYSAELGSNDRRWVPPGTRFRVVLQTVAAGPHAGARREALGQALQAFWLVAHLGSLGTRARRAAGSFSARLIGAPPEGITMPPFHLSGAFDEAEVSRYLGELLPAPEQGMPEFGVLNAESHVWRAGFDAEYWEDAVWEAGKALRGFRLRIGLEEGNKANPAPSGFPDDYHTMKEAVQYNASPRGPVGRASFGLPLTFRFSGVKGSKTIEPEGRGNDRRASPLWIRVVRLPDGRYDAVLTHLGGRLALGALEVRGGRGSFPAPERSLVPPFVQSIATHRSLFPLSDS